MNSLALILSELWHYHLRRCSFCHFRKARWYLATTLATACGRCVPRRTVIDATDAESQNLDECGRAYPGIEWREFVEERPALSRHDYIFLAVAGVSLMVVCLLMIFLMPHSK
jgi:hypothetical protein